MSDAEVLEFQLVENLQREDVHPIEEAEGYERLMKEHGFTADQCAEKVGKSRSYIYGRLKFCALAPDARTAFYEGKLNASTALLVARIPVKTLQVKAMQEIASAWNGEPLSYRAAVEHIQRRYMLDLDSAPFSIKDTKLLPAAGACSTCPKRTGNQPELFADVESADVCTDPDCFSSKRQAHFEVIFAAAKKKGVPIHDAKEGAKLLQADDMVASHAQLHYFERYDEDSIEKLLKSEGLPQPVAYIKRDDGEMKPIYDKTAIQLALEKAGLCLTLEQHTAAMKEKLARGESDDDDEDDAPSSAKARRDEKDLEKKAELATVYRTALYKRIRETAGGGETNVEVLRHAVKMLMLDSSISSTVGEFYQFDTDDIEAVHDFLDQASAPQITVFLLDVAIGHSIQVRSWHLRRDDYEKDDEYLSLLSLADELAIDPDVIRAEVTPRSEEGKKPETKAKKGKGTATNGASDPAPGTSTDADTSQDKGGKKKTAPKAGKAAATPKQPNDPAAAWPFPTGARR